MKIAESGRETNPRMNEISEFLDSLEKAIGNLKQKQTLVDQEIMKSENILEEELEKVEEYYSQFYQLIDEHKNRVIEELKSEYETASEDSKMVKDKIDDALLNSENMKKDINESLNEVILEASEYEFRPVMDLYKTNLTKFKGIYQDNSVQ